MNKRRRKQNNDDDDNGFGGWGGYMEAKKAKLLDQFDINTRNQIEQKTDILKGVAILVNGYTNPCAEELKILMASHGGVYHGYKMPNTTHIIASNLPNVKIKHLGPLPIVKPNWITDSIAFGKLQDYSRYLLYSNQNRLQPRLEFPVIPKDGSTDSLKEDLNCETSISASPELFCENSLLGDNEELLKYPEASLNNNIYLDSELGTSKFVEETTITKNNQQNFIERSVKSTLSSENRGKQTKTASDPKFLEEFYNNSRLHLIATLGAEFKQLVVNLREKSNGIFLGRNDLIAAKGRQTHHIFTNQVIMHIDMDCFFVSVGLRNHPELKGKPVAITHARSGQIMANRPDQKANGEQEFALYMDRLSDGGRVFDVKCQMDEKASMSEIASCSYEARKCGIKNGMFMGTAVKLCPELKTLPYDFEGYKEVSNALYNTIASYTLDIEAVSCDEMYVDVTQILNDSGLSVEEFASHVRSEIMEKTRCPCSTGFGANRLQARLATKKAKPCGQYYLQADDVEMYMSEIPLADLPGVGRATLGKLKGLGLETCGDVQLASLKILQSELGNKMGETIRDQCRGIDRKPLNYNHERKSVSAEVNYGIRFKSLQECHNFFKSLSIEVHNRLTDIKMRAKCLTLKLLIRAADAPVETAKFLGHGVCDSLSKSMTSALPINDPEVIYKESLALYEKMNAPFGELRGVGIQLSKLEKIAPSNKALSKFLQGSEKVGVTKVQNKDVESAGNPDISKKIPPKTVGNLQKTTATPVKDRKNPEMTTSKEKGKTPIKKGTTMTKRGKGRGGGKVITKNTKSTIGYSLNKFLGLSRDEPSTSNNFRQQEFTSNNPLPDHIDINVLNELPEKIRNEIIKEYRLYTRMTPTNKVKETEIVSKVSSNQEEQVPFKKTPFSSLPWDKIKPIIYCWVASEPEPSDFDVDMLAEHLKQLAVERKIEVLQRIFNFLHRIFSKLGCKWHQAYYTMVNSAQAGMIARYGGTLMVDKRFDCCHI